jgi:hypothetical protein
MSVVRTRIVALAVALAVLTACSGCSGLTLRAATPSLVKPVFTSDDEAVGAAVEAYERYLSVSAEIDEDGGASAERVLSLVTDSLGLDLLADYRAMREAGERVLGAATLTAVEA